MEQTQELTISQQAFFRLSYGLYLLSVHSEDFDNACIINTVMQVTDAPKRILFALNNQNFTADILHVGDRCNISVLAQSTPFSLFQQFGFQSGRNTDKFTGQNALRASNGTLYPMEHVCSLICATVHASIPCGTHTVFIADVTEALLLSDEKPVTYEDYQTRIKPQKPTKKHGYVCTVCGYVYEGETLPENYVCPLCKHGAEVFEEIK